MRVLLIYPDAKKEIIGWGDMGAIAEPIALECIAAGARLDAHDVRLLDLRLHREDLDPVLAAFRPDVVGVTGYSMHVRRNLAVCSRVKELLPNAVDIGVDHPREERRAENTRRVGLEPAELFARYYERRNGAGPSEELRRLFDAIYEEVRP